MLQEHIDIYDEQLLEYIKFRMNDSPKSTLNKDLCKDNVDWGVLLHYPIDYESVWRVDDLINFGSKIDFLKTQDKTPLTTASRKKYLSCINEFKEIFTSYSDNENLMSMLLHMRILYDYTLNYLFPKILSETSYSREKFVQKLIDAGSSAYHVVHCRDLKVIEMFLERGFDVNAKGSRERTALLAAAAMDDLELVKILVNCGADVHVRDQFQKGVLHWPAMNGNEGMLRFLLDVGADVNAKCCYDGYTPLFNVYKFSYATTEEQINRCAELLLLHDALPQNSKRSTILEFTEKKSDSYRSKLLISRIAMLDLMGMPIVESLTGFTATKYQTKYPDFGRYHDLCQEILKLSVFESVTLFDLLNENKNKMRILARNENFMPKLKQFYLENNLALKCPLYYKKLNKRISDVLWILKLEDTAIPIILKFFDKNCYVIAREIVGYLNECDLEQLCQVKILTKLNAQARII